jgi:MFS family permease
VILAYMISSTVLVLSAGRLSDLFGRKMAFIFANGPAMVADAFPREQLGMAMGANTMVAAVGLVIGPVLGGALVGISWQWVFWFNVPLALLGVLWAATVLRELAVPDTHRGFDIPGTLTFVVGLTGLVYGISRGGISGWDDSLVIGSLIVGALLLPLFVLIEARSAAPMHDLTIFKNRLFAAATAAAFLNGLSGFALLFIFVMGMLVSALGLALMTTLQADTGYWAGGLYLFLVGIGSGMFNSPNTAAMMGTVPTERRGIAAGARTMLQNTGAVVSIAFVLAIITAAVPTNVLFKIFSGLASGLTSAQLDPFITNMHTALWVLAAISVLGAAVSMLRPSEKKSVRERQVQRSVATREAIAEEVEATP